MKKLTILIIVTLSILLAGCTKGEEFTCTINNKEAVFTLKDGIITKYTLDKEKQEQSKIDEINGEYFTSATNNQEGKEALNKYIMSVGGNCN